MKPAKRQQLLDRIDEVDAWLSVDRGIQPSAYVRAEIAMRFGASVEFRNGTYEIRMLGCAASCTAGIPATLLMRWRAAAERRLALAAPPKPA